jgi:hypothetical protein
MWEYKLVQVAKMKSPSKLKEHLEDILSTNSSEGWRFKENLGFFWLFEREKT